MPASSPANPYLDRPPGPAKRTWIERMGTEEERAWLAEADAARVDPAAQERAREYRARLAGEDEGVPVLTDEQRRQVTLGHALLRMRRQMQRGRVRAEGVSTATDAEIYHAARTLLWAAYCDQVAFETGRLPEASSVHPDMRRALAQVAHWLVGLTDWQAGDRTPGHCLNPLRSLYVIGSVGTGKSTLAKAAHHASVQLHHGYGTGLKLGLTSLDELLMEVYASSDMAAVQHASRGHMVLDELRLKHLGYKHYGNDVTLVADILLNRHHGWKQRGEQTIVTTNVPALDLLQAMGDERITDRVFQQYEMIEINGQSFR